MAKKVIIHIPSQKKYDYKEINHSICTSIFGHCVTGISEDKHRIYMTLPDGKDGEMFIYYLMKAAEELGYELELEYINGPKRPDVKIRNINFYFDYAKKN